MGRDWGTSAPHFLRNYIVTEKKCFQPHYFKSLVSSPTFKVTPQFLSESISVESIEDLLELKRKRRKKSEVCLSSFSLSLTDLDLLALM